MWIAAVAIPQLQSKIKPAAGIPINRQKVSNQV